MDETTRPSDAEHTGIEILLPWYVTGRLDEADAARVDAHLPECAQCRLLLVEEHRLCEAIATLPIGQKKVAPNGLTQRVAPIPAPRHRNRPSRTKTDGKARWYQTAKWLVAAQAAVLLLAIVVIRPDTQTGGYRGLGAAPAVSTGNVIAIFRPNATVQELSQVLKAADATIVDGPTGANAYILRVPGADRARRLAVLRGQPDVVVAEAIDGAVQP